MSEMLLHWAKGRCSPTGIQTQTKRLEVSYSVQLNYRTLFYSCLLMFVFMIPRSDLNWQPLVYKTTAPPVELRREYCTKGWIRTTINSFGDCRVTITLPMYMREVIESNYHIVINSHLFCHWTNNPYAENGRFELLPSQWQCDMQPLHHTLGKWKGWGFEPQTPECKSGVIASFTKPP